MSKKKRKRNASVVLLLVLLIVVLVFIIIFSHEISTSLDIVSESMVNFGSAFLICIILIVIGNIIYKVWKKSNKRF